MREKEAIKKGEILIPDLLAKGMNVKVGDMIVVIATNKDGSVNGKQLKVGGVLDSATGPGGRDGYVHIDDAMEILRMDEQEVSEIAIRLKDFSKMKMVYQKLQATLGQEMNKQGKPMFEIHTWERSLPLLQYCPDDRRYDLFHQAHAYCHRPCEYHECNDYGGLRADTRDRDHWRHRYSTGEDPLHVCHRRVFTRRLRCHNRQHSGAWHSFHTESCQNSL